MSILKKFDFIVVGQGLAGSAVALQLLKRNRKILVIDRLNPNSSSRVAAGLFNPVTGRNLVKTWMADELFSSLHAFYREADVVEFGDQKFTVLFVPGHSPGHIAFYNEKEKVVFAGDVLFQNSIGRTDLPGGNHNTLIQSIHQKLFTLPNDVTVYPGHGGETTIGVEKRTNPFCALTSR